MLIQVCKCNKFMNGSLPFEGTIEQTTGTMPLATKTIATATLRTVEDQQNFQAYESCYTTD